jgi:hypothetical protein
MPKVCKIPRCQSKYPLWNRVCKFLLCQTFFKYPQCQRICKNPLCQTYCKYLLCQTASNYPPFQTVYKYSLCQLFCNIPCDKQSVSIPCTQQSVSNPCARLSRNITFDILSVGFHSIKLFVSIFFTNFQYYRLWTNIYFRIIILKIYCEFTGSSELYIFGQLERLPFFLSIS